MSAPLYSNQQLFDLIRSGRLGSSLSAVFNYLVIVSPGDEVCEKVRQMKVNMRPGLRGNRSLYSKAHLTVIDIPAPYCLEARILKALEHACRAIAAQTISVDGFGNFPVGDGRNVVYLKTDADLFFAQLQGGIKRALRAEGIKRRYARFSGKPHITIAKDLSDASFGYWWEELRHEAYRHCFPATSLLILKRPPGSYTRCEPIATIPFTGGATPAAKPIIKQVCLF